MAKINHITIKDVTRYLETIAYLPELPTATEDSADLVSVNNTLYVKQVTGGVYSYGTIQAGGGNVPSGDGVPVITIEMPADDTLNSFATELSNNGGFEYTFSLTEEQKTLLVSNPYTIIKLLYVTDNSTTELSTWFQLTHVVETRWMYAPVMGQGCLSALVASINEMSPFIESLNFTPASGTLIWTVYTQPIIPWSIAEARLQDNTITLLAAEYEAVLAGHNIKIAGSYFQVPYSHITGVVDDPVVLVSYDAANNEWIKCKETAYDSESNTYTFTLDEEDTSNPYCDGGTGIGGSSVVVNSSDEATGTLTKLTVDGVTYGVPVVEIEDLTSL